MSKVEVEAVAVDRRRTDRADLIVRVEYSTVDELFSEFTRDINEGGLFIETDKPHPLGTEVSMLFNLPGSEEVVRTSGRVVRIGTSEGDHAPGMGIEFDALTAEARQRINEIIRTLRRSPAAA